MKKYFIVREICKLSKDDADNDFQRTFLKSPFCKSFFGKNELIKQVITTGQIINNSTYNNLFSSIDEAKSYIPKNSIELCSTPLQYYKIIGFSIYCIHLKSLNDNEFKIITIEEIDDYIMDIIEKFESSFGK